MYGFHDTMMFVYTLIVLGGGWLFILESTAIPAL